jgi:uncharacterized membrane protein YkvA (DUF1232 family)
VASSATRADAGSLATREPFPGTQLGALVRRLPAYARLAWRLSRDQRLTGRRRAAVLGAAAYLASPIDLVPGLIPVAGQLDDAAVALLGLRYALRGLPASERAAHLSVVGVAEEDLDVDLSTVRLTAGWLVRGGTRLGMRAGNAALRAGLRGARAAVRRFR